MPGSEATCPSGKLPLSEEGAKLEVVLVVRMSAAAGEAEVWAYMRESRSFLM